MSSAISQIATAGSTVSAKQVAEVVEQACPVKDYKGKKVLVIVPDGTRTAPVGLLFKTLFARIGEATESFDILIALGTHQAMSEDAICERLEISTAEHGGVYRKVRFFNHAWEDGQASTNIGTINAMEIADLSGGMLSMGRVTSVLFPVFLWLGAAVPARHRVAWITAFALFQSFAAVLFFTWRPLF